ncbi:MAG: thioredoxin family protein [Desulfobacteraceae bacterium]|nr:thioredoxin family protein [Desulfobacteraceae bacterium]
MVPKESKQFKIEVTKLNIMSLILIILLLLTLFLRHERVCALIYPAPLNQYHEILGEEEQDFRGQKLGLGHTINFQYKENKKSLGELYSLKDIRFIPENQTLPIWKGEDKIEIWNDTTAAMENMQRFRIRFTIPVPDNGKFEGHTIKGALYLKLTYPTLIAYPLPKCSTHLETWNRPMSIHIFPKDDLNKLSELTNQMLLIWISCLALFVFPLVLLWANYMHKHKKDHPPRVV